MGKQKPLENMKEQMDSIRPLIDVEDNIYRRMKHPKKTVEFTLPVMMDNGKLKNFKAYRCQYDGARGPFKGGIRYHPSITRSEVQAMAGWMSWKCALLDLPYGGAKGGVVCDTREMSRQEVKRLTRRYTEALRDYIGPETDIPAPDMRTDSQVMAWIMDTYSSMKGNTDPGVVTGKPVNLGGTEGRDIATGTGVSIVTEHIFDYLDRDLNGVKVAVQGFGQVGSVTCDRLESKGCDIVAVSDVSGGICNQDGLDIDSIKKVSDQEDSYVTDYESEGEISNEELVELDVDILIPAAIGNVINEDNADDVRAEVIVEAANGPTTPNGDEILQENDITVVPDILTNSGGVTVSYLEWVQNFQYYQWDLSEVLSRLYDQITDAFKDTIEKYEETDANSLREATYCISLKRVHDAHKQRGLFPGI